MAERRRIGVLALQGAFEEHETSFQRLPQHLLEQLEIVQVKTCQELDSCDALVIPGGESTTMKIIAGSDVFMDRLKTFVHGGEIDGGSSQPRPVWGTCAGCILLSDVVVNEVGADAQEPTKKCKFGEQIGGLAISTCRNFFGRQVQSFECKVLSGSESAAAAFNDFDAVFIRAPAILSVGKDVRVLARVRHRAAAEAMKSVAGSEVDDDTLIVAAESDRLMVTCFHPELSDDSRIHRYFVERFVLPPSSDGVPHEVS